MPIISITLFEGIVLLIIAGIGVVAWWGVLRLVKSNDDGAKSLSAIKDNLALVCERLGKADIWMDMHARQDDERHVAINKIQDSLLNRIEKYEARPIT